MKLTIPQLLSRKTSVALNIDEDIIQEVVNFQFTSFKEALHEHNSLELTGMGTFSLRYRITKSQLDKRIRIREGLQKKLALLKENNKPHIAVQEKLKILEEDIKLLQLKLNQDEI